MELINTHIRSLVQGGAFILLLMIAYKLIQGIRSSPEYVTRRILKHGLKAQAKVLRTEELPSRQSGKAQIKLLLQVEPEVGRYFVAEILANQTDNLLKKLHSGSKVQVMYDPINREQVILTGMI